MFQRLAIEKDDIVAQMGIGSVGRVLRVDRLFVVTERGVYPKMSLMVISRKCNCGKKH